jgi:hypothetical protein
MVQSFPGAAAGGLIEHPPFGGSGALSVAFAGADAQSL